MMTTYVLLIITTTQACNHYAYEVNLFPKVDNVQVRSLARLGFELKYNVNVQIFVVTIFRELNFQGD